MIDKGFYVHYKGGVYFVLGTARDMDEGGTPIVVYESTQGCGDSYFELPRAPGTLVVLGKDLPGVKFSMGLRYRKLAEFAERVNPVTGVPGDEGIPRFQRIVGWNGGIPLVAVYEDPEGFVRRVAVPFVTQYKKG